jgi:hypothetical protein
MTRSEFYAQFREARKVRKFWRTIKSKLPASHVLSLACGFDGRAWSAACRYGDELQWPAFRRADGKYRSRVR